MLFSIDSVRVGGNFFAFTITAKYQIKTCAITSLRSFLRSSFWNKMMTFYNNLIPDYKKAKENGF